MRLSIQLLGFLVDAEGVEFNRRLSVFMPLVLKCLNLVKINEDERDGDPSVEDMDTEYPTGSDFDQYPVALKDHLLFNSLITIEKIFSVCGMACPVTALNTVYDHIWGE